MIELPRIVYLIGFMGSGKTTAGKKLANHMGWTFTDLDKKIEQESGLLIPEIFSKYGEQHFREIESRLLRSAGSSKKVVISTGGGTPCYGDNMGFMNSGGLTIYLKMTPVQLAERLMNSKTDRPLIQGLENESLLKFIEAKLAEREKFYNMSAIIVDGFNLDTSYLHETIVKTTNEK